MNKTTTISIFFSLWLAFSGCSPATITPLANPSPAETEEQVLPTSTLSISVTTTPSIDNMVTDDCTYFEIITTKVPEIDGFLVARNEKAEYYYSPVTEGANLPSTGSKIYGYVVSPNKKYLFAERCLGEQCDYVLRTTDEVVNILPLRTDWVLWRWLDNERILVLTLLDPHDIIILNPFNGNETRISIDLPNAHLNKRTDTENFIPSSFDISLQKVLFYDETDGGRLVLWDVDSNKVISFLPFAVQSDQITGYDLASGWSPDGAKLITVSPNDFRDVPNELFMLGMEGKITQLSNFNQNNYFANISGPVWSTDSQHIGFFLTTSATPFSNWRDLKRQLLILDANTKKVEKYCLPDDVLYHPAARIVWSPDGSRMVTNIIASDGKTKPIYIDFTTGSALIMDNSQGVWVEDWVSP